MRVLVTLVAGALAALVLAAPVWAGTAYPPIAPGPATVLPDFVGVPAVARPLHSANVPQNPGLAPIPYSYLHNDSWNSDTSVPGPLGTGLTTFSSTLGMPDVLHLNAATATMGFDRHGHMIAGFINSISMNILVIDPASLDVLATYPLGGGSTSQLGNAYWYLDNRERVVVGKGTHEIVTLREGGTADAPTLELVESRSYDLTNIIPAADKVAGMLPDWRGRTWFQTAGVSGGSGPRVGVITPSTGGIKYVKLRDGEVCSNGLAVARGGAYVLTSRRLYKLAAGSDGRPRVVWSAGYDTTGKLKSGQYSLGSGTSPTILSGGKYVAIADNAVPLKIIVYRTSNTLAPGQKRVLGSIAVFKDMAGQAVENSLVGYRTSLIVENCYGYGAAFNADGTMASTPPLPGFARIDIGRDGKLHEVWENTFVASNTVPTLSTATGLIYIVERQRDATTGADAYYWTALDFRTGYPVWRKMAGTGINYDGYWSTTMMGPDGTYYVAAYGGIAAIRDRR
jgi:hypothetical protein